jgi:WS/DGAT/MGAT family acyltransferase
MAVPDLHLQLNGPIGPHRSYGFVAVPFDHVKTAGVALGGTVNHVVLAAVLDGFAQYLGHRRIKVKGRAMRIIVPVALRGRDAAGRLIGDGTYETKASGLVAALPLDVADPAERVSVVRDVLDGLKHGHEAAAMNAINEISGMMPSTVAAVTTRLMSLMPQRAVNTVVTNVPGPAMPLYVAGRPIEQIFNYAPPFPVGARSSVTVYSYNDLLQFGVTADRDSMPDLPVLVDGIKSGVERLVAAAAECE